jgi:hypothetical protein
MRPEQDRSAIQDQRVPSANREKLRLGCPSAMRRDEHDWVMAAERRAAVLITPRRVYTNPQAWMADLVASGFPRTTRERVRTDG